MLFDLKGKRRRAVQGTYLMLAILMGAGLVLFGIGSSTNGGLRNCSDCCLPPAWELRPP